MVTLDGKKVSKDIREKIREEVRQIREETGTVPGLAVIIAGEDSASDIYVRTKEKTAGRLGILSRVFRYPADVDGEVLSRKIQDLNGDPGIDAILVQSPLPDHLDQWEILDQIRPEKDVDRFHPLNQGLNLLNRTEVFPCTPAGVLRLFDCYNISVEGLRVVIVGRSFIVGKPLAAMLTNRNATVTLCHSRTRDLADLMVKADVVISAVGSPGLVKKDMVREGAILVDVGINRLEDRETATRLCTSREMKKFDRKGYAITGDMEKESYEKSSYYTPVPGGIGKMTVAMLMSNTLALFKKHRLKK